MTSWVNSPDRILLIWLNEWRMLAPVLTTLGISLFIGQSRRKENQGWVLHSRATRITIASSNWTFIGTLAISHHGGCANPRIMDQFWEKASFASALGSTLQQKNLFSWAENRVANRSTCTGPQVRLMALKILASTTNMLSVRIRTETPSLAFRNTFKTNKIASISRRLICRLCSSLLQHPPVASPWQNVPHPLEDASVSIDCGMALVIVRPFHSVKSLADQRRSSLASGDTLYPDAASALCLSAWRLL